jgi:hypothetical protein
MANGFGRFFQNLPGQIMGGMPQVPQQPGMGVPSVMGFPAAPGLPAQAPRKGGGWRQNLDLIGSGLREASGESGQLDAYRKRVAGAGQSEKDAQFRANLPPEQQAVYDVSPEIWAQYFGKPEKAERPQRFETPTGIVEFGADGPSMAYAFPEKPTTAPTPPAGYRWRSDGMGLEYIPGGPADPKTVGVIASGRRAPPRKPSVGGGRAPGGGSSAMDAIAAELRRRGKL